VREIVLKVEPATSLGLDCVGFVNGSPAKAVFVREELAYSRQVVAKRIVEALQFAAVGFGCVEFGFGCVEAAGPVGRYGLEEIGRIVEVGFDLVRILLKLFLGLEESKRSRLKAKTQL